MQLKTTIQPTIQSELKNFFAVNFTSYEWNRNICELFRIIHKQFGNEQKYTTKMFFTYRTDSRENYKEAHGITNNIFHEKETFSRKNYRYL